MELTSGGADPRVLPGGRSVAGWRLAGGVLLACGVAAVFGSHGLAAAAEALPEWAGPVRAAAAGWDAAMGRAGLSAPYATVHRAVAGWVRAGWG